MYCNQCGAQIPDNSLFCSHCGARIRQGTQPAAARATVPTGSPGTVLFSEKNWYRVIKPTLQQLLGELILTETGISFRSFVKLGSFEIPYHEIALVEKGVFLVNPNALTISGKNGKKYLLISNAFSKKASQSISEVIFIIQSRKQM